MTSLGRPLRRARAVPRLPRTGLGDAGARDKVARWWGNGLDRQPMEIDVVAESLDGRTLLVGEAKLSMSAREAERTLAGLKSKAANRPFANDYGNVVTRLFVAE